MYELIVGATKIGEVARQRDLPARKRSKTVRSSNAGSSSRHRLEWMWHELPIHVWSGLAMKVIEQPFRCAISLAPFL